MALFRLWFITVCTSYNSTGGVSTSRPSSDMYGLNNYSLYKTTYLPAQELYKHDFPSLSPNSMHANKCRGKKNKQHARKPVALQLTARPYLARLRLVQAVWAILLGVLQHRRSPSGKAAVRYHSRHGPTLWKHPMQFV